MTPFVIDASVILGWLFFDEKDPYSVTIISRLRVNRAIVPALFPFEIANALVTAEKRQRITAIEARRCIERLSDLPIQTEWLAETERVFWIARRTNMTAYDAAYLEVADRLDLPLATRDERLRKAATIIGVAHF